MPSARACTQAGTENCTAIFSVEVVLVQAQPAAISQKTISGTLRLRASVASAPLKMTPAPASIHSAGTMRRRRGSRAAPITAPDAQAAVEDSIRHGACVQILSRDYRQQRPNRAGETGKQKRAQQDRDATAASGGRSARRSAWNRRSARSAARS